MTEDPKHMLALTGDAGIKSAQDVAARLLDAIENHDLVAVDTQTVSVADVTTIQTLLAARLAARARQRDLIMLAPLGKPLQAVLEAAGFVTPGQEHADFWPPFSDQPAGQRA